MTISIIDLRNRNLESKDLILLEEGWSLKEGCDRGYLFTGIITPKLACKINGFEIPPSLEYWVRFGIIFPNKNAFAVLLDNRWEETAEPKFYNCSEMRGYLKNWIGEMKLLIQISRTTDLPGIPDIDTGVSPLLSEIKINFTVPGNIENYILNFGLKEKLSTTVTMAVQSFYRQNGEITKPKGYSLERISNVHLIAPDERPEKIDISRETWTYANESVKKEIPVTLMFDYLVGASFANSSYHELTDVPSIIYRKDEERNTIFPEKKEYIFSGQINEIGIGVVSSYDLVIEVQIVAYDRDDIMLVADSIYASIKKEGFVEAKPWGQKIGIEVMGATSAQSGTRILEGMYFKTFKVIVYGIPRGEWEQIV